MSLRSTRYLVSACDHDLYEVVVEAADRSDAIRKAEVIYLTDGSGGCEAVRPGSDMDWRATPVVAEVRR